MTHLILRRIVGWVTSFGLSMGPVSSANLSPSTALIGSETLPAMRNGWTLKEYLMPAEMPLTVRIARGHRGISVCSHRTVTVSLCQPNRYGPPTQGHRQGQRQGQ